MDTQTQAFYRSLYPFPSVFAWLNQESRPTVPFSHREFAFTLPGDIYLRYQSFATQEELRRKVIELNPSRFEIGALYTKQPRLKKELLPEDFKALRRELVFDIDLNDYDPVRTCCSQTDICGRCWAFISVAVRIIDNEVRTTFDYRRLLWVYSGRRGIHLWVSDPGALDLSDRQRKGLVGWFTYTMPSFRPRLDKKVAPPSRSLDPFLESSLPLLKETFNRLILVDQNCFANHSGSEALLQHIPDQNIVSDLRSKWSKHPHRSSVEKWSDCAACISRTSIQDQAFLKPALDAIIIHYTFPRIDANVSKYRSHLLKAPFCIHPDTGHICIPIDPTHIEDFIPSSVPTLTQLLDEIRSIPKTLDVDGRHLWRHTSLRPYVEFLQASVLEETASDTTI